MATFLIGPVQAAGYPWEESYHEVVEEKTVGRHLVYSWSSPWLYSNVTFVPREPIDVVVVYDPPWLRDGTGDSPVDGTFPRTHVNEAAQLVEKLRECGVETAPRVGWVSDWFAGWKKPGWVGIRAVEVLDAVVIDPAGAAALRYHGCRVPIVELPSLHSYARLPTLAPSETEVLAVPDGCPQEHRPIDVCFVGYAHTDSVPLRAMFLERLQSFCRSAGLRSYIGSGPTRTGVSRGTMEQLLLDSKVCFNLSLGTMLNMRTYEALAAGCVLVTDAWNVGNGELEDNAAFYRSFEDVELIVRTLLADDESRQLACEVGTVWAANRSPDRNWRNLFDLTTRTVREIATAREVA